MRMRTFSTKEFLDETVHPFQNFFVPFQVLDYRSEFFRNLLFFSFEHTTSFLKGVDRFPQRLELDIDQVPGSDGFNTDKSDISTGDLVMKTRLVYLSRYDSSWLA